MATFDYTHVVLYIGDGDGALLSQAAPLIGTISDGEADTTFEAGDLGSDAFVTDARYLGTTIIDGQTWPAFYSEVEARTFVYLDQAPVSPPNILQVNETGTFGGVAKSYDYTHILVYIGDGDGALFSQAAPLNGAISDGEADTTFEPGDFGSDAFVSDARYLGTTIVDGQAWPVFYSEVEARTFVYMNQAPVSPPNILQIDETGTFVVCFAAGTLIATPKGDVAVERLAIGDPILTSDGRTVPVRWIGLQTKHKALTRERDFSPVRVKAGALGDGLPHTDLLLTGDHALIIDGLAINAAALVNGTTIAFEPMGSLPDSVTYYHIETENHEEILANGAPAETFVDYVGRRAFDNHQEYLDLYGCERIIPEMRRPRISARRQLPAATAARFGIAPFGADVEADAADLMARRSAA